MTSAKAIILAVAEQHRIDMKSLLQRTNFQHIVRARQEAMYRLKTELGQSHNQIARRLQMKHHTTIVWGVRRHAERTGLPNPCPYRSEAARVKTIGRPRG